MTSICDKCGSTETSMRYLHAGERIDYCKQSKAALPAWEAYLDRDKTACEFLWHYCLQCYYEWPGPVLADQTPPSLPLRTPEEHERLITNAGSYMRLKLTQYRTKPHWLNESADQLSMGLQGEWSEFFQAYFVYKRQPTPANLENLRREAADVHNYLEMLLDKLVRERKYRQNFDEDAQSDKKTENE